MRRNRLRELLNAGASTLATNLHSTWPSIVEVVGHSGMFDYVVFAAEYAPFDLFALDNFCRAVELFDMSCMIKVDQAPRSFLAQRAIGAGFQGVLFADCRGVEDARECIQAVRPDTPESGGIHGAGLRRNAYMLHAGTPAYVQAMDDVVIALMIEKKGAVEQLEEILALGDIDMIFWGPADYCMSIGKPGAWDSPEVRAVWHKVIETCLRMGVSPCAEINSPDQAKYYLDMGVRHFSIGVDIMILYSWMKENGEATRKAIEGA